MRRLPDRRCDDLEDRKQPSDEPKRDLSRPYAPAADSGCREHAQDEASVWLKWLAIGEISEPTPASRAAHTGISVATIASASEISMKPSMHLSELWAWMTKNRLAQIPALLTSMTSNVRAFCHSFEGEREGSRACGGIASGAVRRLGQGP